MNVHPDVLKSNVSGTLKRVGAGNGVLRVCTAIVVNFSVELELGEGVVFRELDVFE